MRRAISALLLCSAIITTTGLPAFSQKIRVPSRLENPGLDPATTGKSDKPVVPPAEKLPPATGFSAIEAYTDGSNAYIHWQMSVETGNFGFNVFRVDADGGRKQVNPTIINGAAIKAARVPIYGAEYDFMTPLKGRAGTFVVETVPLAGKSVSSDVVDAKYTRDLSPLTSGGKYASLPKARAGTGKVETADLNMDAELSDEVRQNLLEPDPVNQKWIAAQPGVKLGVRVEGLYRVTKTQLQSAGFDVASDPSTWQLFTDGREQAINVDPNGNFIEFYGKPIDLIESDTRMYYLIAGPTQGRRMATRPLGPSWTPLASRSYSQTFVKKERLLYIDELLNGPAENYFGNSITSTPYTITFNLSGVDMTSGNCTLNVKIQGFSFTGHTTNVNINGHPLAPMNGANEENYAGNYTIPVSFLNEGSNSLTMQATDPSDFGFFDQFSISYNRTYLASQNKLSFYTQNYHSSQVTGFTSSNIRLFDTTDDGSPVQLLNPVITSNAGTFGVKLPAYRGRLMFATADSAALTPFSIAANTPSNLSTPGHNANLVIVTYKDFAAQAETWANYRRGQGYTVEVIDVADIFDEFNFGIGTADSLKAFFLYAKTNWQTPPQYILLLGDGSFDPRNYEGGGYNNLVPAKLIPTLFSETVSDDALVDFNGDGLAEIAIGRIPVRDSVSATNAFNKVVNFEQPANQTLNNGTIFAYDVDPNFDFGAMSGRLRNQMPVGTPALMVGRTDPNAAQTLVGAINTGKYLVNYSGHGSVGVWSGQGFFSGCNLVNVCNPPQPQISNPNHESIFLALTCLNGFFIGAFSDSLSERLLKSTNGGAVVVWASSGLTTPDVQEEMGTRFYSQIGTSSMTRMGDYVLDAKGGVIGGPDVRLSFVLIGDPLLKIKP